MILANVNSGPYKFVLVLHILAAIVGFGGVLLNGAYALQAKKRPGPGARAISEANYSVSLIAEKFIYAVPLLGFALIGLSDEAWKFSQTWIWLALVLYVGALGLSHAVLIPGHRRINVLLAELELVGAPSSSGPPPQVAQIEAIGKRQAATAVVLQVALVAALALMVWKPS
jgi:uncharacterized membrane protein